jgi:hypothetical protein
MSTGDTGHHCRQLLALLATDGDDESDEALERRLTAHAASCPECRAGEADLRALLQRYCRSTAPPLDAALESRLLDRLCGRSPS